MYRPIGDGVLLSWLLAADFITKNTPPFTITNTCIMRTKACSRKCAYRNWRQGQLTSQAWFKDKSGGYESRAI